MNINYSSKQAAANINNSIDERKFLKIIITSIFSQSKIISSRYFIDIVNQFSCNIIHIFMFKNLMSSSNLLYLSMGKPKLYMIIFNEITNLVALF